MSGRNSTIRKQLKTKELSNEDSDLISNFLLLFYIESNHLPQGFNKNRKFSSNTKSYQYHQGTQMRSENRNMRKSRSGYHLTISSKNYMFLLRGSGVSLSIRGNGMK